MEFFDRPFALSVAWIGEDGLEKHYFPLEANPVIGMKASELILGAPKWVFHNAKFDLQKLVLEGVLWRGGFDAERIEDTEAIAHLLDEYQDKGLKKLAIGHLGFSDAIQVPYKSGKKKGELHWVEREEYELAEARRARKLKKADGYHLLPRKLIVPYSLRDAELTILLYDKLKPQLERHDDLMSLYEQEMRLTLVLLDMEAQGLGVNVEYLTEQVSTYGARLMELEINLRELTGEDTYNPNSNPQNLAVIRQRVPSLDWEKTDEGALKRTDDVFASTLLDYRKTNKIRKTYLMGLLAMEHDGVVHPHTRQHKAKTGRMSSGGYKE